MTDEAEENNQKDSKSTIGEKFKRVHLVILHFLCKFVIIFYYLKYEKGTDYMHQPSQRRQL